MNYSRFSINGKRTFRRLPANVAAFAAKREAPTM
jgi:hypothetical protein